MFGGRDPAEEDPLLAGTEPTPQPPSEVRSINTGGEGEYRINDEPCRLKDIQRLFMDTGIGTNSYSVMEQGKIDQILSSRPDDRRVGRTQQLHDVRVAFVGHDG